MEIILYILAKTVSVILGLASFAMVIRMIMPIFFDVEDSSIFSLACFVSEPIIAPVRLIMVKLNIGQDSPVDWSFFVTYLILWLLRSFLPTI